MNNEIKRCKDKRSENIGNYICKIREEISSLWDLCKINESERKKFGAFYCDAITEDLLTLHEIQAENLRKHYNANRQCILINFYKI